MPKVFICYRREDSEDVAGRIYDRLVSRYGAQNVVLDVDDVPIGVNFRKFLDAQVRECDALLAIIGRDWLKAADEDGERRLDQDRDYLRIEIESAKESRIPVIPVLVRRARPPTERDLPPSLSFLVAINAAVVSSGQDFDVHMRRLMEGIDQLVGGELAKSAERTATPERGEPGLTDPGEQLLEALKAEASRLLPTASWVTQGGWWFLGSKRGLHVLRAKATRNTLRVRVRKNPSKNTGVEATSTGWIAVRDSQPVVLRTTRELRRPLKLFESEWL